MPKTKKPKAVGNPVDTAQRTVRGSLQTGIVVGAVLLWNSFASPDHQITQQQQTVITLTVVPAVIALQNYLEAHGFMTPIFKGKPGAETIEDRQWEEMGTFLRHFKEEMNDNFRQVLANLNK